MANPECFIIRISVSEAPYYYPTSNSSGIFGNTCTSKESYNYGF